MAHPSHAWHTNYPPHYGYTKHTIFNHMSSTPTIQHITGTQIIPYFITCLAHQLATTFWAHRTFHISSHVWHTNYPPHYGHTEHIFHHMPGTSTILHITGTQNIPYLIICLAHQQSTTLRAHSHTIFYHMSGTTIINHILDTQNIPYFIIYLARQLSTLRAHRSYHISSHVWNNNYLPHFWHTEHTIFHHLSGTPTVHHVSGTHNISYFISCLAHQLSTTLQAHKSCHISSHIWHPNCPPHYGYTKQAIFH